MGDYIDIGNEKALKLDEWKGFYSISQHRKYNDKWYWDSVRIVKGKDEVAEKNTPAKIQIGDKKTAIKTLRLFLEELDKQNGV